MSCYSYKLTNHSYAENDIVLPILCSQPIQISQLAPTTLLSPAVTTRHLPAFWTETSLLQTEPIFGSHIPLTPLEPGQRPVIAPSSGSLSHNLLGQPPTNETGLLKAHFLLWLSARAQVSASFTTCTWNTKWCLAVVWHAAALVLSLISQGIQILISGKCGAKLVTGPTRRDLCPSLLT